MTGRILQTRPQMTGVRWILLLAGLGLVVRVAYVLLVERGDPLSGDGVYYH